MNMHTSGVITLILASSLTAQWTETTPAGGPSGRGMLGMAYDPTTGNTVIYGGDTFGFPVGASNETWSYDGANWTQLSPLASPPAASGIQMAYDLNRGVFVYYGGLTTSFFGGPSVDETWEFDGATWSQVFPVNTPGGLGLYGMCYDSVRGVTVLYGGLPDNFFPIDSDQTWEWNGTDWTNTSPANNPGPLERPGMCFHEAAGVTVLFGGIDVQTGGNNDTWLYDGTDWTVANVTGPRPSVRTGCSLAYDGNRQICVMTGGQDPSNGTPFNDTWEFDLNALTWTQVPSTYTDARLSAGLVYDSLRKQMVMFGGVNYQTFSALGDTWEYGARSETFGTGCPGSNGVPALDATDAPRFGATYTLNVSNLEPSISTAVLVLSLNSIAPIALDGIGMPGCTGYVSPDLLATASGSGGSASYSIAMPTSVALIGTELSSQALGFDPNLNALWLSASNGHRGTLGN